MFLKFAEIQFIYIVFRQIVAKISSLERRKCLQIFWTSQNAAQILSSKNRLRYSRERVLQGLLDSGGGTLTAAVGEYFRRF